MLSTTLTTSHLLRGTDNLNLKPLGCFSLISFCVSFHEVNEPSSVD